jgi:hypothetical protein
VLCNQEERARRAREPSARDARDGDSPDWNASDCNLGDRGDGVFRGDFGDIDSSPGDYDARDVSAETM